MSSYFIKHYKPSLKTDWDALVASAKNNSFLFYRDFMEYHKERFKDYSLMVYKKKEPIALLPANADNRTVYSHQGLSYGGLILAKKLKFKEVLELFKQLLIFMDKEGFDTCEVKTMPSFYTGIPTEELDYLCFLVHAELCRMDIASVIDYQNRLPLQKNRLEGVKKGNKNNLKIEETTDLSSFWNQILIPNLSITHKVKPVHKLEEISRLQRLFPQNIRQFNVLNEKGKIVAGTTIFESDQVAHVQYISGNKDKQQLGSLDFLFNHLINEVFSGKRYFDFGTSNQNAGKNLNEGLQYWKEGFGGRSMVHRTFRVNIKNHHFLNDVLI